MRRHAHIGAVVLLGALLIVAHVYARPLAPVADGPQAAGTMLARGPGTSVAYLGWDAQLGRAALDGVWDFEDGTLQGWTTQRWPTQIPGFRQRRASDFADNGDAVQPTIDGGTMWVGLHSSEIEDQCWPGGMGYGNGWEVSVAKTFPYMGENQIEMEFDYYTDCEDGFDWVCVTVDVADTSFTFNPAFGEGCTFTGAVAEGANIGTPAEPAHAIFTQGLPSPFPYTEYAIRFTFYSDVLVSDEWDNLSSHLDTYGGFGFDNFEFRQCFGLNDCVQYTQPFHTPPADWVFSFRPWDAHQDVARLADLDMSPSGFPGCPIGAPGNKWVMYAAKPYVPGDDTPPHGDRQWERMRSPGIYVGPGSGVEHGLTAFVESALFADTPDSACVYERYGVEYYPWTCPETEAVGWSPQPVHAQFGGIRDHDPAFCGTLRDTIPFGEPFGGAPFADVDSVRVVIDVFGDCVHVEGGQGSTPAVGQNRTPYWDDVRLGVILPPSMTRTVPTEVSTIQGALDASASGDTVRVEPGTYGGAGFENLDFGGRSIVLVSEEGPATTFVDGMSSGAHAIVFDDGEGAGARVSGFTFTNFTGSVIQIIGSSPRISGNVFENSSTDVEPVILVEGVANPCFDENVVRGGGGAFAAIQDGLAASRNTSVTRGGGAFSGTLVIRDCLFDAISGVEASAVRLSGGSLVVTGSTFANNQGDAAIRVENGKALVERSIFADCGSAELAFVNTPWTVSCSAIDASEITGGSGGSASDLIAGPPLFCDPASCLLSGDYRLDDGSPCLPEESPCGALVGAFGSCNVVAVDPPADPTAPPEVRLLGNRPNPFNPSTTIRFELAATETAALDVFDVSGRRVRALWRGTDLPSGTVEVAWDGVDDQGTRLPSGVYFYVLDTDVDRRVGRMVRAR